MSIKPIVSLDELNGILASARDDGHTLVFPSHALVKDNVLIGAVSALPTFLVWTHTKQARARDGVELCRFLENHVRTNMGRALCLPCTKESPYYSLLEKDGFINIGDYSLFVKGL